MKLCFNKFYLFVSGLIMLLVGGFIALAPYEYLMSMDAQSEMAFLGLSQGNVASTNLMSDLRGMGGMLLFIGVYVLTSTYKMAWRHSALLISTLVYTAFVIFRTTGFIFEGFPSIGIITAYFIELAIAGIGVFLIKTNRQELAGV